MTITPEVHTLTVTPAELKILYLALFSGKELAERSNSQLDERALTIMYQRLSPFIDQTLSYQECFHRVIESARNGV